MDVVTVVVDLGGPLAVGVRAFVQGDLGWHVIADGGPERPSLVLADAPRPDVPTIVVLDPDAPVERIRDAALSGALDVLRWPADRARLAEVAHRMGRGRQRVPVREGPGPTVLRVAGLAGGAGASTLVLALGASLAWSGRRVVVVGSDDLFALCGLAPWQGPGAPEAELLDVRDVAAEVTRLARGVPGVERLAALTGPLTSDAARWPVDVVVCDQRTTVAGADLLVVRPDASLRRLRQRPGCPVVCNGAGPLSAAGLRRGLGVAPARVLPDSARVARAGVLGQVPAGLPGSWLAAVRALLAVVRS